MKIRITESQLNKVLNEVGGYDDADIMNKHAQNIQAPLLQTLASTVEILQSFVEMAGKDKLENKEMIDRLKGEIYLDADFKDLVTEYKLSLKRIQNYLRLLYSDKIGMSYDMTKTELIKSVLSQIESIEDMIEKMSLMFQSVHGRYRSRLNMN
jgi:2-hydroxy-3-keto-5-methylthiopentenyl-1-phosphate phosphatase